MDFPWGRDPDPQPERARQAAQRLEQGTQLLQEGDRDPGIAELEEAAELAGEAHTEEGHEIQARTYLTLADALPGEAGGRAERVLEAAVEAGREAATVGGFHAAAHAAERLARRAAEADEVRSAIDRHREAFELAQHVDTPQGDRVAAVATLETGRLLREQARFAEAIEALERAVDLAGTLGGDAGAEIEAGARWLLGRVHEDAGSLDAAKRSLEAASERGSIGSATARGRAAGASWTLADIHATQGNAEELAHWYERAVEHALAMGDPAGAELAARVGFAWGARHEERGETERARDHYAEAARLGQRADTEAGQETARQARSRNVQLASGSYSGVDVPESPEPDPFPVPPIADPEAPLETEEEAPEPMEDPEMDGIDEPEHATPEPSSPSPLASGAPNGGSDVERDPVSEAAAEAEEPDPRPEARWSIPEVGHGARGALLDRAETLHELAIERGDEESLEEALRLVDEAREASPRDADLLHLRAQLAATLALWRDDEDALREALSTFEQAFQQHGGRVDPTTHKPGPNFFFDWGRATYELARRRGDEALYRDAHERLGTGYEMTPRGARHLVASALMARCRFGEAETAGRTESYEEVVERYEGLEEQAPFALEAEDHAIWARALARRAAAEGDEAIWQAAFDRMAKAYERA